MSGEIWICNTIQKSGWNYKNSVQLLELLFNYNLQLLQLTRNLKIYKFINLKIKK